MPDKDQERYYLKRLMSAIRPKLQGSVSEHEPPDFVVSTPRGRVGIEFTVFYLPPKQGHRPYQEQQNLRNRIVELARSRNKERNGKALYLTVFFQDSHSLKKQDCPPLAEAIVRAVEQSPLPGSITETTIIDWKLLPEGVNTISMHGSIDGIDQLWSADSSDYVAKIETDQIQTVISDKFRIERRARSQCDELWLVVVNEVFSIAPQAEIDEIAKEAIYEYPFEKVLWLEPHIPRATALAKSGQTAPSV